MSKLSKILLLFLLISSHSLKATDSKSADPICLAKKCGQTMLRCGVDGECRRWLQCVLDCGDDKIRCPSVCGFYYQSARINQTSLCIFESDCVNLGFEQLPHYDHVDDTRLKAQDLAGTWWFKASYGGSHIFDFDCQRFDFTSGGPDFVRVAYSVPLTLNGTTRMTGAHGVFRQLDSGATEVIYDNFAGYHEKWNIVDKSEDSLLAHVCIDAGSVCYDYGTILLTKNGISNLDLGEIARLDRITRAKFGFAWEAFKQVNVNCSW